MTIMLTGSKGVWEPILASLLGTGNWEDWNRRIKPALLVRLSG